MKKIVIDNNIIDFNNIKILENTNIFDLVRTNQLAFFASEKLFNQLIPFLKASTINERKTIVKFLKKLIGNSRLLDTVKNISQREIKNQHDKFWFIPSKTQKQINYSELLSDNILDNILSNSEKALPFSNEKQVHDEIIKYMNNQRKIINDYTKKSYKDIDKYLQTAMQEKEFDAKTINAVLNIVKNFNNADLSTEEKKKQIYENYFNLMVEFSLLSQLREDGRLISDKSFFDKYYNNYYTIAQIYPFTKKMIDLTLYGYSYKVIGEENPKYDKDWSNDNSYLCYMHYADILLTNDKGYMKNAFNAVYSETEKEILTLDEFIKKYCKMAGDIQ